MLGGAVRTAIPTYANHGIFGRATKSEQKLERALRARELGFDMFKWDPFHHGGNPERAVIEQELQEVALFRKGFGDDFKLAVDAHARFDTAAALIAGKGLEPFDLIFFEEPVAPENLEGYRQVAGSTSIPIASGERLADLEDTRAILETGSLKFLQLEPGNVGGLLEASRGAAMARAYGVQMVPHDWVGPVLTRATTHLCATLPNLFRQEYPSTAIEDSWENDLLEPPTVIKGASIAVPNGAGLGSRLNEKLVAARRVIL
jgi:galactonate dehydratase